MDEGKIELLTEYAEFSNDESGEYLISLHGHSWSMGKKLKNALESELESQYKFWTTNYSIVDTKEEYTVRSIVEREDAE